MSEQKTGPIDSFFIYLANKFDGKKTWSGLILIVGGIVTMIFTPDYRETGSSMIASGISLLLVGLTHKAIKRQDGIRH